MIEFKTEVLVVGAGPAGLAASALLAEYGVDCLTFSRHGGTADSPRAHITNQRSMEVFRDLGIEDRISSIAMPNRLMANNVWAGTMAGPEHGRIEAWGAGERRAADYAAASPSAMCNLPQHLLEPVLLAAAREKGAAVGFGVQVHTVSQSPDGVVAQAVDRESGEQIKILAQYAIGADGGNSTVAQECGFGFSGWSGLGGQISCWISADLTEYCAHRPGVLYWLDRGALVCVRPWDEWNLVARYDPAQGEPDLSDEAMRALAHELIGDPGVRVQVKSVRTWQVARALAKQLRRGRVFLAGDAAHRHPPNNGLGTNTAIQDAYNLAWKLALVLRGQAGESLLDSYQAERGPVAKTVVGRAFRSMLAMNEVDRAIALGEGLERALALQHYQFNCHGVELGQFYVSGAVLGDGRAAEPADGDPLLYHQASTLPGAVLPHAWIEQDGRTLSTLDLAGHGCFSLLTGTGFELWRRAAEAAQRDLGVPVAVHEVADWSAFRGVHPAGALLVRPDRHIAWSAQQCTHDGDLRSALASILGRTAAPPAP